MSNSNKTRLLLIAVASILLGAIIIMITIIQIKTSEKKNSIDLINDISNQVKNNVLPISSVNITESETVKTLKKNKSNFIEASNFDNDFDGTGQASLIKISRKLAASNQFSKYSSEFFPDLSSFFSNNPNNQFAFIKYISQKNNYTILPPAIEQITSVKIQNNVYWISIKNGDIYISEPDFVNEKILKVDNSSGYFNLEIVTDLETNPKKDKIFIKYRELIRSKSRFASYNILEIYNIDFQKNSSNFSIIDLEGFVEDIYKKGFEKENLTPSLILSSNPFASKNVDGDIPNDPIWNLFISNNDELYILSQYQTSQIWSIKYIQQQNTIIAPKVELITNTIFPNQKTGYVFINCETLTNACWAFNPSINTISKIETIQTGDKVLNVKQFTTKLDIGDISKTEDSAYEFDLDRSKFLVTNTSDNSLYFYSLFDKFKIEI